MYFTKLRKGKKVSNAVLPWPGINVPLKERDRDFSFCTLKTQNADLL